MGNCVGLSSLYWNVGWPKLPKILLADLKFVIHTVNFTATHWGVIIVQLHNFKKLKKLRVHVYMYEPLKNDDYHEGMEEVWKGIFKDGGNKEREGLRNFLVRWHIAYTSDTELSFDPIDWVEVPQQPGLSSCGVMVVAQLYNFVTGNFDRQHCQVTKTAVKVMRLRMLWIIMCYSQERSISPDDTASVDKIQQQLLKQL
ncbi:unnamed protein product [Phytophthora fragariaefolia]|uniref:Unnamed protein product n=1 Tax=Phytophthora fragariaefolia TaxID=1490495 RepID=A0A9W6Y8Q5_9STRA|nr:unnamed protein product [Phytophthora fragariaefolia]